MDNVLIDSSVWINYFRQNKNKSTVSKDVNLLLDDDRVVLCSMVELEILQGLRGALVRELFGALRFVDTQREDFVSAGLLLNQSRSKGITVPSSDCLIAALCIRHHLSLYTLDQDFNQIHSLKRYIGAMYKNRLRSFALFHSLNPHPSPLPSLRSGRGDDIKLCFFVNGARTA
jgi:predicted nucleic acid-binding protein